jgi:dipeptidyl aminopeptidase/acylaminoacyl peptidase
VLETRDRHDVRVTAEEAPAMVRAFESAIDALDAQGLIDPDEVGIIGFSRTCYYIESALIHAPRRYAAAVIADGVDESYLQYLLFGEGRASREEEVIYGTQPFGPGLQKWVETAPGFNLHRLQTPLLIQAIAPPAILEEWEIYASLRLQKKPVEMIYFPRGQHILQKPLERLASQQGDVDWFRFWLQGYEDRNPAKLEQYRRWRELRKLRQGQDAQRARTGDGSTTRH